MLTPITPEMFTQIKNPVLKQNARIYQDIESSFYSSIEQYGLPRAHAEHRHNDFYLTPDDSQLIEMLERGVEAANDNKSFRLGWISPSCLACRKGVGSVTYTISTRCPRDCFFCFNPNQDNYERLQHQKEDPSAQISEAHAQGMRISDIALTGGEPLVHKQETVDFFQTAKRLYPLAYTRLYTSGTYLDAACVDALTQAGLDEIRFSLKTDDTPAQLQKTFDRIRLARESIPHVMVEMPVMPDECAAMQNILLELDRIGIDGINLLELCFPFNNVEEFRRRGYQLKRLQFRVLYNYWYAGGLPVSESESVCLKLLEFALDNKLTMGVHYCSLENKFTGQIYQQNYPAQQAYAFCEFSERDFFLKSAKAYGKDAQTLAQHLSMLGKRQFRFDKQSETLEFLPSYLILLKDDFADTEIAISYHVVEQDNAGSVLRELRLDLTTPATFDYEQDV